MLLRNLLKQLAQKRPSLPACVSALYKQGIDQGTSPSLEAISLALQTVVGDYSKVFIIVDALDESPNASRNRFLAEILNLRHKLTVNIFATSRHNTDIASWFEGGAFIEIYAQEEDIREYLSGNMHLLPDFVRNDERLKNEIEKTIVSSVQGMFLLAKLHLNSLIGKFTIKDVRNALEKLSTRSDACDHAYEDAMKRIDSQDAGRKDLARRALSFIVYAKRKISAVELQHALAVENERHELDSQNLASIENIILVCAGLVTLDHETGIIRLVHYTAQDYFERTQASWFPSAERAITKSCVTYLSFSVFDSGFCSTDVDFEHRLSSNPFYNYAAHNWGHHAQKISPIPQELIAFIKCDLKVQASSQVLMASKPTWKGSDYSQQFPKKITGLHLAAYFGIGDIIETILNEQDLDADDGFGRTPLSYAAGNGFETVARLLLHRHNVNPNSRDRGGQTPLMWAAKEGHYTTAKLLLATDGVDASVRDYLGQTAL
ncbi:hypothetical protein M431DRAFT_554495, partial [Trichoderma harzianum CBS 226.95]